MQSFYEQIKNLTEENQKLNQELKEQKENQLIIMLALAELYEKITKLESEMK